MEETTIANIRFLNSILCIIPLQSSCQLYEIGYRHVHKTPMVVRRQKLSPLNRLN